ncbi:NAD-dependent deacylase [Planomicrobium sp. CPCC 101110]|uniref:NAD-dependent deacylase n=1 Tax=Planomicrobium sp. CPCC 101110 TaxID=2599619 RepID=UPI0011B57365|nr:NAD-dependent deacylase [Planomicrobium sp. CPCC 101110]TWT25090.1 NAD-dependent deacylase [Planomicrobium sp. CPCC 101110]
MIKEWLKDSSYTVVFTGAGMSTESGLPDFRSANQGLWEQKNLAKIASIGSLYHNPEEFTEFYRSRMVGLREYGPHKGHYLLAEWEKRGPVKSIITQNVDGFHQLAGSSQVAELHGTLQSVYCQECSRTYSSDEYLEGTSHCVVCGGVLRPSIVLFGEMLPEKPFELALQEASRADLFIVLGSSLSVSPANQFPLIAKENGSRVVIVNREPTQLDGYADEVVHDRNIGDVLEEWDRFLKQ